MIFDCCLFSGEIDHLLIRLTELEGVVDYFVVVEATSTFQGDERDLVLPGLLEAGVLDDWLDRIIPVYVGDPPHIAPGRGGAGTDLFMLRERYTRDAMMHGYIGRAHIADVILVSDVDEIPTEDGVREAQQRLMQTERCVVFKQDMYVWDRGHKWPGPSWNTCAFLAGYGITPQEARDLRGMMIERDHIVHNGGWHLSWQGGPEAVRKKLATFSHAEHLDKMDSLQAMMQESLDINGVPLESVDTDSISWPIYFAGHPGLWR